MDTYRFGRSPTSTEVTTARRHTSPDLPSVDKNYDAQSDWMSGLTGIQKVRNAAERPRAVHLQPTRRGSFTSLHRAASWLASDLTQLMAASASVDVGRFSMLASVDVDRSSLCAQLDLAEALTDDDDAVSAATTRANSMALLLPESPPSKEPVELLQKLAQLTARPPLASDVR